MNKKLITLGTGPDSDWKLIFISAATLSLVLVAIDVSMFLTIHNSGAPKVLDPEVLEGRTLNLEALRNAASYYKQKKLRFESILSGASASTTDPSL